jgi:hypothetical protein
MRVSLPNRRARIIVTHEFFAGSNREARRAFFDLVDRYPESIFSKAGFISA